MENHIIGGAIIERDGKYLLVQEADDHIDACKGKWGAPGGHIDLGETILETAVREAREETGCDIALTGVCQIGTMADPEFNFIVIVFAATIITEVEGFTSEETTSTRWFSYDEICAMKPQLRSPELVIGAIDNLRSGLVAPLSLIKKYPPLHKGT